MPLRRLTVLSGNTPSPRAEHVDAANRLGGLLAENGITLLYPGEAAGALAALAAAVEAAEGRAIALPPEELAEAGDGFLALPGGPGNLEQLFATALSDVRGETRPCGLLNTGDYFSELLKSGDDAVLTRFVRETQRGRLIVERDPAVLLRALADFRPPETRRQAP